MTDRSMTTALLVFSSLHVVVMATPAVVLAVVAGKGGVSGAQGFDLLAVSLLVGLTHASLVWKRLRYEFRHGFDFVNVFIAEFDALVVLALLVSGLFLMVLGGFAPEHAAILNHGWPVVGLWAGVLFGSVIVAELVRTAILRWLAAEQPT